MAGDITRDTFDPKKHYKGVYEQQGRVHLDADWNEQVDITNHRIETETVDVIGGCGTPISQPGFQIIDWEKIVPEEYQLSLDDLLQKIIEFSEKTRQQKLEDKKKLSEGQELLSKLQQLLSTDIHLDLEHLVFNFNPADFVIRPGRYYVDGILCENENDVWYTAQSANVLEKFENGFYLVYLDVWERPITFIEDDSIRETALKGPDTTTRLKTIWQVKLQHLDPKEANCITVTINEKRSTGKLTAKAQPDEIPANECEPPSSGGYRRLENQLYRVEIHQPGDEKTATFKWSRENGSIVKKWEDTNGNVLTVSDTGPDEIRGIQIGDWVELLDDKMELAEAFGILRKVSNVDGKFVTVTSPGAIPNPDRLANPKIRRWESDETTITTDGFIPLGDDGVVVKFEPGQYNTGDYWLIPARTINADVEWPKDEHCNPIPQEKHGINHHYCKLGIIQYSSGSIKAITDCRNKFPSLTELTSLHYVGGDGQEGLPNQKLPYELIVGVSNGSYPVQDAQVAFSIDKGGMAPSETVVTTGADGLAKYWWTLGPADTPEQQITAKLINSVGLPVIFTATIKLPVQKKSCCYTVGKGGDFETFDDAITTIQDFFKDEYQICLCLLPGQHSSSNKFNLKGIKSSELKISGSVGAKLSLKDNNYWNLVNLASFTMENIYLEASEWNMGDDALIRFINCGEVIFRGNHITGRNGQGFLLGIGANSSVILDNNQIDVGLVNTIFRGIFEKADVFMKMLNAKNEDEMLETSQKLIISRLEEAKKQINDINELARLSSLKNIEMEKIYDLKKVIDSFTPSSKDIINHLMIDIFKIWNTPIPGPAIFFDPTAARVCIQNNVIVGQVSFYGSNVVTDANLKTWKSNMGANPATVLSASVAPKTLFQAKDSASLLILNNSLTQLTIDSSIYQEKINTFTNLFLDAVLQSNIFEDSGNVLAAAHLSIQGNVFRAMNSGGSVGISIGVTGIYMGNRGVDNNTKIIAIHHSRIPTDSGITTNLWLAIN